MVSDDAPAHSDDLPRHPLRHYHILEGDVLSRRSVAKASSRTLTRRASCGTAVRVTSCHSTRAVHGGAAGSSPGVGLQQEVTTTLRTDTSYPGPVEGIVDLSMVARSDPGVHLAPVFTVVEVVGPHVVRECGRAGNEGVVTEPHAGDCRRLSSCSALTCRSETCPDGVISQQSLGQILPILPPLSNQVGGC